MKSKKSLLPKKSGRSKGRILVRHQGGREKRFYREIDFKRDKRDVWGVVEKIEYDPNRKSKTVFARAGRFVGRIIFGCRPIFFI